MFSRKCSELNEIKRRLVNLLVGEFPFVPNGKYLGKLKRNPTTHILPLFLHSNLKGCDLLIHYSFSNWASAIQYGTGHKPNLPEVKRNIPRTAVISICLFNISHLQKSKHLTERKRLFPTSQLKIETHKMWFSTMDARVSVELASYNKYFHFWSVVLQICSASTCHFNTTNWHLIYPLKCFKITPTRDKQLISQTEKYCWNAPGSWWLQWTHGQQFHSWTECEMWNKPKLLSSELILLLSHCHHDDQVKYWKLCCTQLDMSFPPPLPLWRIQDGGIKDGIQDDFSHLLAPTPSDVSTSC